MADEVDDAGLHDSLRKNGVNGLWKTLQAIHDGDQNVLGSTGLELVDDAQPARSLVADFTRVRLCTIRWSSGPCLVMGLAGVLFLLDRWTVGCC